MPTYKRVSLKRYGLRVASGDRTVSAGGQFPFGVQKFMHSQSPTFSKAVEEISDAKLWQCRDVDRNLQVISLCGLYTLQSGDKGRLLCLRTLSGYQIFQAFTTSCLPTMSLHNARAHTKTKLNSVALVRTRTIPTERLPPVDEVSANFCG